jgi:hypothetical protein
MGVDRPTKWRRLRALAKEPPIRLLVRSLLRRMPVSVSTRARWDISDRPAYLLGLMFAAEQARLEGIQAFSAIEFGVAGGTGLLALQQEAEAVEAHTGIAIKVYGFDIGSDGLPEFIGDYRDHPDVWRPGDFPTDIEHLKCWLSARTRLILGDVRATVPGFFDDPQVPPVGFVAIDLDLYSSTKDALRILSMPERRMLVHVPVYCDDIDEARGHRFGGELLAIEEFNDENQHVKIDVWRGIRSDRPFADAPYLEKMFMAHDLEAISKTVLLRDPKRLNLITPEATDPTVPMLRPRFPGVNR